MKQTRRESKRFHAGSDCQKTYPAESFGGKNSVKGNRHTEPQRGVSERNRRIAAALGAEMGSLSRSITRRSDQNCKIILQILILQFCRQLVPKVLLGQAENSAQVLTCAEFCSFFRARGDAVVYRAGGGLLDDDGIGHIQRAAGFAHIRADRVGADCDHQRTEAHII